MLAPGLQQGQQLLLPPHRQKAAGLPKPPGLLMTIEQVSCSFLVLLYQLEYGFNIRLGILVFLNSL
jgi:hypothetical protein